MAPEEDSRLLVECAQRLERVAQALKAIPGLPGWIEPDLDEHARRCRAAAAGLAEPKQ